MSNFDSKWKKRNQMCSMTRLQDNDAGFEQRDFYNTAGDAGYMQNIIGRWIWLILLSIYFFLILKIRNVLTLCYFGEWNYKGSYETQSFWKTPKCLGPVFPQCLSISRSSSETLFCLSECQKWSRQLSLIPENIPCGCSLSLAKMMQPAQTDLRRWLEAMAAPHDRAAVAFLPARVWLSPLCCVTTKRHTVPCQLRCRMANRTCTGLGCSWQPQWPPAPGTHTVRLVQIRARWVRRTHKVCEPTCQCLLPIHPHYVNLSVNPKHLPSILILPEPTALAMQTNLWASTCVQREYHNL